MSLQAKIEAVIYASEEPVTLAQLMGLLGEEAQAELDALDSRQGSLSLALELDDGTESRVDGPAGEASGDQDALNAELLDNPTLGEDQDEADPPPVIQAESPLEAEPESSNRAEQPESSADERAALLDLEQESGTDAQASDPAPAELAGPASTPSPEQAAPVPALDEKKQAREKERRLRDYFRSLLDRLMAEYADSGRGLEIREVAGGFRMATKPEFHDTVRGFVKSLKPPLKLSLQALETLAVIAYKQPVTAPEISEIRGVESGGVLGTLMARKLIGTAGRKSVIGRPMLYRTTKEFLVRFGLKDINELPSIEEFEKMAGELAEPVQEEIPMAETAAGRSEESGDEPSPALDELDSPPASKFVGESADEVAGGHDRGTPGTRTEPSSGVSQEAAAAIAEQVEPSRDIHEAQADGVPDTPPTDTQAIDDHEPYTGNDQTGA